MKQKKKRNKPYKSRGIYDLTAMYHVQKQLRAVFQKVQLAIEFKLPRAVMNQDEKEACCFMLNFIGLILEHRHQRGLIYDEDYKNSALAVREIMGALLEAINRSVDKGIETYGSTGDELRTIQDGFAEFYELMRIEIEERPQTLAREFNATIYYCDRENARIERERAEQGGKVDV